MGPVETWPQSLKTSISTLLECKLPMYIAWGKEWTQFYNDAYRPILGAKHPAAMGISVQETWPEIWPTIGPMWAEVWQGKSFGFDNFMLTIERYGYPEDCYFNFSYSPVRTDNGDVSGILVTFAETTEKVLAAKRLQAEREKLYSTLMQAPASVAVLKGPDLVFDICNPRYFELVGKDSTILGQPLRKAIPELEEETFETFERVFRTGEPFIGNEYPARLSRNGKTETAYFNFIIGPARDQSQNIESLIIFAYEVSAQVLSRQAVEKLNSDLEDALRARDEFLSIASHELKTPLTSLSLQLQSARRRIKPETHEAPAPEVLAKVVNTSMTQVTRLTRLVEDLLDVARIQSNKIEYKFQEFEFSQLLKDVVESHSDQIQSAKCTIELKIDADVIVYWDQNRIEQVVVNLLSNSLKYSPGTLVTIALTSDEERVQFKIQDHGPGIPKDRQSKIFERFERATSARNISGLGLGLYITRQIVTAHQGTIQVESDEGRGTTFIVEIPKRIQNI